MANDLLEIVGEDYTDLEDYDYDDLEMSGLGAGIDYEMGARRKPKVVRKQYSRARRQLLPFSDSGDIAIGATADLLANPQVPFKPERLIIQKTSTTGEGVISDIRVGKNSQLISSGNFPISLFQGDSNEGLFSFDTARPGIDIVISIVNAGTTEPLNVTIGMVGVTLNR